MTYDEVLALPKDPPVLLADGKLGLLIRSTKTEVGVQVPGEDNIRWLPNSDVFNAADGALMIMEVSH